MTPLIPYFSLATIPGAARWTPETSIAFLLVAALAVVFSYDRPHLRRDVVLAASGTALTLFVAVVL